MKTKLIIKEIEWTDKGLLITKCSILDCENDKEMRIAKLTPELIKLFKFTEYFSRGSPSPILTRYELKEFPDLTARLFNSSFWDWLAYTINPFAISFLRLVFVILVMIA